MTLTPAESNAPVRVNGRAYRGSACFCAIGTGITVVNRVGLESYLLGVVSAEMGRRSPGEQAALRAQAVVSRTYALRNLGRWKAEGFDLSASVDDQVYGGLGAETRKAAAVAETRGRVLTYNGAPIEAFFYSTCGGRTADGTRSSGARHGRTSDPFRSRRAMAASTAASLRAIAGGRNGAAKRSGHARAKPAPVAGGVRERGDPGGEQCAGDPAQLLRPGGPAGYRAGRT